MQRISKKILLVFASLKLTIFTLLGIGVTLFTGMFWDQTQDSEILLKNTSSLIVRKIFFWLELGDVYHSWWFSIFIILLSINLIACSIVRLPKLFFDCYYPIRKLDNVKSNYKTQLLIPKVKLPIFNKTEEYWTENNYHYIFFQKQNYARCGVYIVHTALLLIMFGSICTNYFGFNGVMMIPEGGYEQAVFVKGSKGVVYKHNLNLFVFCSKFKLKTYQDGSPMSYESKLSIYDKKNSTTPLIVKTIGVNNPLKYQEFTFYQTFYKIISGEKKLNFITSSNTNQSSKKFKTRLGGTINNVTVVNYYKNYGGLGEAVQLQQKNKKFIIFKNFPNYDRRVRRGELQIIFTGLDEIYITGITVAKVPGISVVFSGFCILFLGIYITFCMNQRRYYAKIISTESNSYRLYISCSSSRYPEAFGQEVSDIVKQHNSI